MLRFFRSISVAAALLAAGAAQAEIKITDTVGREVRLEKPAERIFLGFYFEDFIAIAGPKAVDRLVAVALHNWKGYRPKQYEAYVAAIPKIKELTDVGNADHGTLSAEKIISARPDVALLAVQQYQYLGENVRKIEAAGIPIVVVDYNAQTVEKHVASTLVIGKVTGEEERAARLAKAYKAAVDDTVKRVAAASAAGKPKVYVELGQKGAAEHGNTYGKGMWGGVVDLAGGQNIAAGQIASWGPLNPEYVLGSRPDKIFIAGSEWTEIPNAVLIGFGVDSALTRERVKPFMKRPGWAELPAVKNGEVYALYHGGSRTIYDYVYLRYIAKVLYPEAFKDVDPEGELKAFYAANLPIKADGAFMLRLEPKS